MKKQIFIGISAILIFGLSCSKHYFDINNSPNSATNASPELVLSNALTASASPQEVGFNFLSAWMGYLGQSGSYATGVGDIGSYKETNNFGNGIWLTGYHNLADYDYVEKSAVTQNKFFYEAAAKVMKAYIFQELVDMFNNVPYTEAFEGTNNITPKYDSAQSVYNAITLQIDSAIMLFQRSDAIGSVTSDVLFKGDNTKWIGFGNSLKLRILIRQSQVASNASFVQAELGKITANGGGFLTTDAAVNPGYANNAGQQNPIWGFNRTLTGLPTTGGSADFWKASQYAITWMTTHNDPRYKFLYAPGSDTAHPYKGSVLGAVSNPPGNDASTVGPGILKSVSQSAVILSLAESYFLQAEANLRGWLGAAADAQGNFNKGVQASFDYLGAGDATSYLAQNDKMTNYGACTSDAERLACIIRQKWIAMDEVTPFEAWCDYRRLKLPADIPLSVSPFLDVAPASIPTRILYPTSEYQTNSKNANAQGANTGTPADYHSVNVFWNQ